MPLDIAIGDLAQLQRLVTSDFARASETALHERGRFVVALSGGSVAPNFFPALSALPIDWSRVDFFWVDERAVPPTDPDSNFAAALAFWLQPAAVPRERIHRMEADNPDLARAASLYEQELLTVAGSPPHIDFALLGVGPDGHIASLFPNHPALEESVKHVAVVEDSPKPPPRRLTLTLRSLCSARYAEVIALGESKADAIAASIAPGSSLPLARLLACTAGVHLRLDEAAAKLLPKR